MYVSKGFLSGKKIDGFLTKIKLGTKQNTFSTINYGNAGAHTCPTPFDFHFENRTVFTLCSVYNVIFIRKSLKKIFVALLF